MISDLEHLNVFELPFVPVTRKNEIPAIAAVYFVLARKYVYYVGQSGNIHRRWLSHEIRNDISTKCRIAWLPEEDEDMRLSMERWFTGRLRPRLAYISPAVGADRGPRSRPLRSNEVRPLSPDMTEFTSSEAATYLEHTVSAGLIRNYLKTQIDRGYFQASIDYRWRGRELLITLAGLEKFTSRNRKPGPKGKRKPPEEV